VVSLSQLSEMGIGRAVRSRWVEQRRLHRIHPGVYAVGHPGLGLEGRLVAALFYAGPGAALCGITAASWLGFLELKSSLVHVCTPRQRPSLPAVCVRGRRSFERVRHRRLPVTPPARTLLDIASEVRFKELRRALSEAEYLRLVTVDEVRAQLGRGKLGAAAMRRALARHDSRLARTKQGLEEEFFALCERVDLAPDDVNVWISGWRVDAVWYDQCVIVELDSRTAHEASWRLDNDHRRDLALRAAGYTVLRYTWRQVTETPELVAADLRRALELRL